MTTVSELISQFASNQINKQMNQNVWSKVLINVQSYGAKGDGVTDDTNAIKSAVSDCVAKGGTLYFPPGKYVVSSIIDICFDADIPQTSGLGINIRGDNANTTSIINTGSTDFIFHVYESFTDGRATASYFHMNDITIVGTSLTNKGIHMVGISEQYFENVMFNNFFTAFEMEDVVRCRFVSCTWNQNRNGLVANDQINISTPNAIDFLGCVFYGNAETGAYFKSGANINFFGGTIETNGHTNYGSNRWGIKLQDLGRYGGAGASFFGTYFEGNANIADVWISHDQYPATYSFHGCTFNKFASPKNNINNIYVDATNQPGPFNAPAKVIVTGCSFRDMGNTPDSSTRYIGFYSGGTPIVLEQYGNYFQSSVELPDPSTNRISASARIVSLSSTPSLWRGFNIDTIAKNGVGDYTINFVFPSVSVSHIINANIDQVGFVQCQSVNETSIRIHVFRPDGVTAFDPGELDIICLE